MGTFKVEFELARERGGPSVSVQAWVDTGASHTAIPGSILRELGIEPDERWPFQPADDRVKDYDVGQASVRLEGRERATVVVFADEGSEPLLGATTLEEFRLGVDPVARRLVPVRGLLL